MHFLMMLVFALVFPARSALAHEAPVIVPTRLEFDATSAPQSCHDKNTFTAILTDRVGTEALAPDAQRRLTVRIRRSPSGGKLVDLALVDASGATLGAHRQQYLSKIECHKVLWDAARIAARLLGAFEKPPAPEPCPVHPVCPTYAACPTCPAPTMPTLARTQPAVPSISTTLTRRAFVTGGVFLGTGITPAGATGPQFGIGFIPSLHAPRIQLEIQGGWARQSTSTSAKADPFTVDMVPFVGSICYFYDVIRICSGLVTTLFTMERRDLGAGNDQLGMTLAGSLRAGGEFNISGPLSIRVDAFVSARFWERASGNELATLLAKGDFNGGASALGVWSFE